MATQILSVYCVALAGKWASFVSNERSHFLKGDTLADERTSERKNERTSEPTKRRTKERTHLHNRRIPARVARIHIERAPI